MSEAERSILFFSLSLLLWEEYRLTAYFVGALGLVLLFRSVGRAWGLPI